MPWKCSAGPTIIVVSGNHIRVYLNAPFKIDLLNIHRNLVDARGEVWVTVYDDGID